MVRLGLSSAFVFHLIASPSLAAVLAQYNAGIGSAPNPTSQGWIASTDFVFQGGPSIGQSRPAEPGTYLGPSSDDPPAWEIYDVQDDGDDADGTKSATELYYREIGDQSNKDWILSFEAATLSTGAANPNMFGPLQGSNQSVSFHYQVPYVNNAGNLRFRFWRVELAASENGDGTFDLWALGREAVGGPPNFVRGKHALLLDDVPFQVATDFYQYQLRYFADTGTASLFFNSGSEFAVTAAANFVGDASGIPQDIDGPSDHVVAFGSFTESGEGHVKVRDVLFSTVTSMLGDFDSDGDVDGRDFLTWQRNPTIGNLSDWQNHYGMAGQAAILTVPEPNYVSMLILAAVTSQRVTCRSRVRSRCFVKH